MILLCSVLLLCRTVEPLVDQTCLSCNIWKNFNCAYFVWTILGEFFPLSMFHLDFWVQKQGLKLTLSVEIMFQLGLWRYRWWFFKYSRFLMANVSNMFQYFKSYFLKQTGREDWEFISYLVFAPIWNFGIEWLTDSGNTRSSWKINVSIKEFLKQFNPAAN